MTEEKDCNLCKHNCPEVCEFCEGKHLFAPLYTVEEFAEEIPTLVREEDLYYYDDTGCKCRYSNLQAHCATKHGCRIGGKE
jgi:hypothetical protein